MFYVGRRRRAKPLKLPSDRIQSPVWKFHRVKSLLKRRPSAIIATKSLFSSSVQVFPIPTFSHLPYDKTIAQISTILHNLHNFRTILLNRQRVALVESKQIQAQKDGFSNFVHKCENKLCTQKISYPTLPKSSISSPSESIHFHANPPKPLPSQHREHHNIYRTSQLSQNVNASHPANDLTGSCH